MNAFLLVTARTRLKDLAEPSDDGFSGKEAATEATSQRDPVLISCRGEKPKTPEQQRNAL